MPLSGAKSLAVVIALILGVLAIRHRHAIASAVRRYFTEPSTPFNLAVFRIAFFTGVGVLLLLEYEVGPVRELARLPRELVTAPQGFGGIADSVPLSPTLVSVSYVAALVCCFLAAIGLFTRTACWGFVLSLAYYLTVPQLFGKVDHYHHILWLGLIFAVSRSGDALSIDSVRQAWRRRPGEETAAPPRGLQYSLPLRFTWLLMGVIYLFPGLYKYKVDGLKWLDPSTLEFWMYSKWYELDGWRPLIRVDEVPALLTAGAAFTLVFECAFLCLVIFPRARPFLAVAGLGFHNSTNLLMRIPFYSLQVLYVSLIDWEKLSARVFGRRGRLTIGYDGSCGICRKTVASLGTLSLPGALRFVNVLDAEACRDAGLGGFDTTHLLTDMHLRDGDEVFRGYHAYRRLAWRVPPLWPVLPLLYLPPVKYVGSRIYGRVAWSRSCSSQAAQAAPAGRGGPERRPRRAGAARPIAGVGSALVVAAFAAGVLHVQQGWPISHYPTFSGIPKGNEKQVLVVEGRTASGKVETVDLRDELSFLPSQRFSALLGGVLSQAGARRERSLRVLMGAVDPAAEDGTPFESLTVRRATVSIEPDSAGEVLASSRILTIRALELARLPGR
jgi:predicted DCC family thiol-disulfide oxidoreductase YuxK/uncharacterized membrane protein YphA (DoxX/SURF4 family)